MDKDQATVRNMVAKDFAGIDPKGKRQNKTQLLDEIKTSKDTLSGSVKDSMEVHVYGPNVATVVGTSTKRARIRTGKHSAVRSAGSIVGCSAT
jgi:hypothetical protein